MSNSTEQSKAHRLFFFEVTAPPVFTLDYQEDYWDKRLGEAGYDVLQRFIAEGLIEPVPLTRYVERGFTKEQITELLRSSGLKLSGKKAELAARLVVGDPEWARQQAQSRCIYERTAAGNEVEKTIAGEIGNENGELEAKLLLLIHDGLYEEAYWAWAAWDAEQLDPLCNERNVDDVWRAENSDDFVKMAQQIAAILPEGERERLLTDWLMGERDFYEHSLMTQQHGKAYERDLVQWRKAPFVAGIQIHASPTNNQCSFAKHYEGCYRLEDAPDHPFGPCDQEPCCTCGWECIFDDEQPAGGWNVPAKRHPQAGGRIEVPDEPITEERIRRLAEVMNTVLPPEGKIREEDIQKSLINSGLRKPRNLLQRLFDKLRNN